MDKLKIGIDVSRAYREHRGIPIYTRNILQELAETTSEYEYLLLSYSNRPPQAIEPFSRFNNESIPFTSSYRPWKRIFQEQYLYPRFQQELGLDVVWHPQNHGQWWTPVGYVVTLHDIMPLVRPDLLGEEGIGPLHERILDWSRIQSVTTADKIITVSEFSKREICTTLKIDPARVEVIYNGINHSIFNNRYSRISVDAALAKYNLPQNYLLTVGSYAPHKNLHRMIDAYKLSGLWKQGVGLVLIGPKNSEVYISEDDSLENYAVKTGMADHITMLDGIPTEDLVLIYNGTTAFLLTSHYEGFGFSPIEAMACGVPAIVSNTTAVPEVCGNAALYADPSNSAEFANAIAEIYTNKSLTRELIEKGFAQASRYSWHKTARETLNVLVDVGTES